MARLGSARHWISFLLAAAITAACACRQAAPGPARDQVEVEVRTVDVDRVTGGAYVMLEDRARRRGLPIWIGDSEARAILLELHGVDPERPLTNDLLRSAIEKTGSRVDRVVITALRDKTYYADIYLDGDRLKLDSRPSDAIALALGAKAPIYVANRLFEDDNAVDLGKLAPGPHAAHAWGLTVQEITPDIAGYFDSYPGEGVLVADAKAAAADAGVQRGDVIRTIGSHTVRSVEDFEQSAAALRKDDTVSVMLEHSGVTRTVTLHPGHEVRAHR
jgi:bifunctional DNase/RNase